MMIWMTEDSRIVFVMYKCRCSEDSDYAYDD